MTKKNIIRNADYVPLKEKILYGGADFYGSGYASMIGLILLTFMTKSLGIDPFIAGTIVLISKAWDAISDPLMGAISDNTRTKIGRRRPWIIIGGALIPVAFMFLFAPVGGFSTVVKTLWAGIGYVFLCTINTISQVPYCSMSSEISSDFKQRNIANSIKLIFSMIGAAVCFLLPTLVFEAHLDYLAEIDKLVANGMTKAEAINSGLVTTGLDGVQFFLIIGLGFGIVFAISVMLCGIFVKERVPYNPDIRSRFSFASYKEPFKVKSFVWHLVMYVTAFMCMDIVSALAVYYVRDVMQGVTIFGQNVSSLFIVAPMMVMAGLMYPFILIAMKKKSKQFAYRMGLPFYILGAIVLACFPRMTEAGSPTWIIPIAAIVMGAGVGGAQMMPWMVFPDAMDVAELKTGIKNTGSYSGLMTFARKLSSAFAIWIVGVVLKMSGYNSDYAIQPLETSGTLFLSIRLIFALSVVILISIAIIASFKYKITDKKLERVRYYLDVARAGKLDELTDEEIEERQALIDELA